MTDMTNGSAHVKVSGSNRYLMIFSFSPSCLSFPLPRTRVKKMGKSTNTWTGAATQVSFQVNPFVLELCT